MKVALILTGHMRCWNQVFPNTKEKILDRFNPDVFISTWDNEGYWTSPENDPDGVGLNTGSPKLDITEMMNHYNPIDVSIHGESMNHVFTDLVEEMRPFCDQIRPQNIVPQFYKIHDGYNLMSKYVMETGQRYDWVIRMRPDLVFHETLPDFQFFKGDEVVTIEHPNHKGQGVGDMFLLANYAYSLLFNSMLTLYPRMAKASGEFCPHVLTEKIIAGLPNHQHMNLPIKKTIMHTPNGQYKDWKE